MHLGRGRHRRSLSASRACGDRVHRLEVSSLTSDTRRVADITPTVFLPFSHAGRLPLDALDRRPGGAKGRGSRPGAVGRFHCGRTPRRANSRSAGIGPSRVNRFLAEVGLSDADPVPLRIDNQGARDLS